MRGERFDALTRLLDRRGGRRDLLKAAALTAAAMPAVSWVPAVAQEATPAAGCAATTVEENLAIIRRNFNEVWNNANIDLIDELYADEFQRSFANRPGEHVSGKEALAERIRERRLVDFPD